MASTEGWNVADMPSLAGKIAIVTGANCGIGFATATALAQKGASVILACRHSGRGRQAQEEIREKTGNDKVEYMKLDLASVESTRTFAKNIQKKLERIDILINNAAVLHPIEPVTKEGFESHFGINYLGHFLLTSLLFELLKQSADARVVSLSSMIHRIANPNFQTLGDVSDATSLQVMPDYSASKFACLMFSYELHRRVQKAGISNIKIVASHPGVTLTKMSTSAMYAHMLPQMAQGWLNSFMGLTPVFQSPEMGALPSLYEATGNKVQSGEFYGPDGWGACWGHPVLERSSGPSHSRKNAKRLWARSEELLKSTFSVK